MKKPVKKTVPDTNRLDTNKSDKSEQQPVFVVSRHMLESYDDSTLDRILILWKADAKSLEELIEEIKTTLTKKYGEANFRSRRIITESLYIYEWIDSQETGDTETEIDLRFGENYTTLSYKPAGEIKEHYDPRSFSVNYQEKKETEADKDVNNSVSE